MEEKAILFKKQGDFVVSTRLAMAEFRRVHRDTWPGIVECHPDEQPICCCVDGLDVVPSDEIRPGHIRVTTGPMSELVAGFRRELRAVDDSVQLAVGSR
jgi:hypothetical protein